MALFKEIESFLKKSIMMGLCFCPFLGGQSMAAEAPTKDKIPLIVLIGGPGSGKGTLATSIVKDFGVVHISTGDMFRYHIKNETPIGKKAKSFIEAGKLAPDELVIDMLKERLQQPDCQKGALLDGFPRTLAQAKALESSVNDKYNLVVLYLDVSDATIMQRLAGRRYCPSCNAVYNVTFAPSKIPNICDVCGATLIVRNDDREETVRDRLSVFHQQNAPLIPYYEEKGVLTSINGEKGAAAVAEEALRILHEKLGK